MKNFLMALSWRSCLTSPVVAETYFETANYFENPEPTGYTLVVKNINTGVAAVGVDANASAEYFTTSGLRVHASRLAPGVYIMRKGAQIRKIVVR